MGSDWQTGMQRLWLDDTPAVWPAEGFTADGLSSLFYAGPTWQGKPTRVFAWLGLPEGASAERPVPGIVLVHGGGGTAFAEWVRLWNARGYAAIAMDTCGCVAGGEHAKRNRHPDGGPPGWHEAIRDQKLPPAERWFYHAVAAVIHAHTLLRSFAEVDAERVGLTGISWGGYLTCLAAGLDPRFRFAAPVYGCGFLPDNSAWLNEFATLGPVATARWRSQWDPGSYLPHAQMPMLWVSGTNDFAYPLDSLRRSYLLPRGERTLAIRVAMPHGQEQGAAPPELPAFANQHCLGGPPLPLVGPMTRTGTTVSVAWDGGQPLRVELNATCDTGPWQPRQWQAVPARVEGTHASAELPAGATAWYFNLVLAGDLVVSSMHEVSLC